MAFAESPHSTLTQMSSTVPLSTKIKPPLLHKLPLLSHSTTSFSLSSRSFSKSHICFAFPPSSNSGNAPLNYGPQEEARWLREEQRWLREEQRWIREESRWKAERETLLQEINSLMLRIQELERLNSVQGASVSETVANIAKLLQVLKEGEIGKNVNRIAESGSIAVPLVVKAAKGDEEVIVKEVIKIADREENGKKRETIRKGSEGDKVRAMQEALQKLGFYCGEEDMEYSSFSSGTERAVKTWQATLGAPEDGIMTSELLERLYIEQKVGSSSLEETKNQELKPNLSEKALQSSGLENLQSCTYIVKSQN
ncbi:plastid transcriptionally active 5 [Forsythia ovata]|uniref:Plastid transcriptionally active 5 n=1 Tax=Forsythia ovata TaxID=205694 RepID=A0ABD1V134_9LAMI